MVGVFKEDIFKCFCFLLLDNTTKYNFKLPGVSIFYLDFKISNKR